MVSVFRVASLTFPEMLVVRLAVCVGREMVTEDGENSTEDPSEGNSFAILRDRENSVM